VERFERPMCGRKTATSVGVVHDVIVDQRCSVEDLERCCQSNYGLNVRHRLDATDLVERGLHALCGSPSPVAKPGAKALAAAQQIVSVPSQVIKVRRHPLYF
jgi:hypothetical protein